MHIETDQSAIATVLSEGECEDNFFTRIDEKLCVIALVRHKWRRYVVNLQPSHAFALVGTTADVHAAYLDAKARRVLCTI